MGSAKISTAKASSAKTGSAKGGVKTFTGTDGADTIGGSNGNDVIDGRGGADTMRGGRGDDVYYVDNAGDQVVELAGEGLDEVRSTIGYGLGSNVENLTLLGTAAINGIGNALNNRLFGNDAANALSGGGGTDLLVGALGDDILDGGAGADHMDGGFGNDTFIVDNAADFVMERMDSGTDTVLSSVSYSLHLELENLTLTNGAYEGVGNYRDNQISGSFAANRLDGREGNDVIDGGAGADVLIGGLGADTFAFTTALGAENVVAVPGATPTGNVDAILDFQAGLDRIALDDAVFAGLAPGALVAAAFRVGTAAIDADDRILYDPTTGNLSFDADGIGGVDAVAFATLQPGLLLAASDFAVI